MNLNTILNYNNKRDDLSMLDWIQHTQEELMDATLYLEKLKKTILEKMKNTEN